MFDRLVVDYFRDFPRERTESKREIYMRMDVRNAEESAATKTGFKDMVEAASGIGMSSDEFLNRLATESGFTQHVFGWAQGDIPNGLARKIILSRAEMIIREAGAVPAYSMDLAA